MGYLLFCIFWLARGIAHGLFALILDWSKYYYFAFGLVKFNPIRCNGDFLTRLVSHASPRLHNFCNFCLAHGLFALIVIGQSKLFCFCSWSIQSNQGQWWLSHPFSRASRWLPTLLQVLIGVRIVFLFAFFWCSLWLVKVNYFAFYSCDIKLKTALKTQHIHSRPWIFTYKPYTKSLFTMLISAPKGKWVTPPTKT